MLRRWLAWFLDMSLLALAALALVYVVTGDWWFDLHGDSVNRFLLGVISPGELGRTAAVAYVALFAVYFTLFEGLAGTTIAKRLLGMCLVRTNDRLLNPLVSGLRTLMKGAEWALVVALAELVAPHIPRTIESTVQLGGMDVIAYFFLALLPGLVIAITPEQRRLADFVSGTIVVAGRIRNRRLPPQPVSRPNWVPHVPNGVPQVASPSPSPPLAVQDLKPSSVPRSR